MSLWRDALDRVDIAAGLFLPIRRIAYIDEPLLEPTGGVYSAEDWSRARALGYRGAGVDGADFSSDDRYLSRIFAGHVRNTKAAIRFSEMFGSELSRARTVLELGCGEMIQAHVLQLRHPHLRYIATDFDPFVIERCGQLRTLHDIEKRVLDVTQIGSTDLAGVDLVLAWEVAYALNEDTIRHLLEQARAANVSVIAGTTQLIGPFRAIRRSLWNAFKAASGRAHGCQCSTAVYARLASGAGMRLTVHQVPLQRAPEDNFAYLQFEPR